MGDFKIVANLKSGLFEVETWKHLIFSVDSYFFLAIPFFYCVLIFLIYF